MKIIALILIATVPLLAHDSRGRSSAPVESRRLKNPLVSSEGALFSANSNYARLCASCHGEDGKSRTRLAGTLPYRPTDLTNYLMEQMKDGEIYWVITNGVATRMPAFTEQLTETQRWELVLWVRELRVRQLYKERIQLGSYQWQLPPGFPHPKVPADNLMTAEKVELGRHLFYDLRLSFNEKQSCATCHQQSRAFTDGRGRGVGSTGEVHPRGPMSLINVAYSPVLTWANPNMKKLEQQALVPLFGDHPVELGMQGKEDLLLRRLHAEPRYGRLFAEAFPGTPDPFTIANVAKAIAAFERTLLSGDSPYDEYRRGDDPDAISASAKRGEALFFGERLECFHCHGGFNFTGTVDYLGKGSPEIEFHNNGISPAKGPGLYEFTQREEDKARFKAPTLRNIALTAPYMHDGSVKTLEDAIEHYKRGGVENANRSEFVKSFALTAAEKQDVLAFLRSLTDSTIATNPRFADPWRPAALGKAAPATPKHLLKGAIQAVYAGDGSVSVSHGEVAGLFGAGTREFLVADPKELAKLAAGAQITAGVRKRGNDYVLEGIVSRDVGARVGPTEP
jgi:cytochrome c peroxidase